MKYSFILILGLLLGLFTSLHSQNETEIKVDGLLIPRVDRNTVSSPSLGQLIFDTTTDRFWFYDGSQWLEVDNDKQSLSEVLTEGNDAGGTEALNFGKIGIGTSTPDEKLDVDGAIKISTNIDTSPEAGTIRWNATTNDFEGYTGSAWKSLTNPNSWNNNIELNECNKLTASDGAASDFFGFSVSISGDYAIVGAHWDDDNGSNSGSAYIFKRSGTSWAEEAKLTASDGAASDFFGRSVSISGDYAIVGAHWDDDNGSKSGSAYIFKRSGTSWAEEAKLTASDGDLGDLFGWSVSISGDYAIVGAKYDSDNGTDSGSAYIFKRSGTSWAEEAKLTASDGAADDRFGFSVSISGDYAIVGAYYDDDNGSVSGSAYIFKRSGTSWAEEAKLTASDGAAVDLFGRRVSISGDYAIVGAHQDNDNGTHSGSAYIFKRSGTSWAEEAKLTASDGAGDDRFGFSVSISGDYAIVGAYNDDDNGTNSGSAYIFKRSGTSWAEEAKLTASDGAGDDRFGISVSISGDYAIVGAYNDDDNGGDSGSAYIFE